MSIVLLIGRPVVIIGSLVISAQKSGYHTGRKKKKINYEHCMAWHGIMRRKKIKQ